MNIPESSLSSELRIRQPYPKKAELARGIDKIVFEVFKKTIASGELLRLPKAASSKNFVAKISPPITLEKEEFEACIRNYALQSLIEEFSDKYPYQTLVDIVQVLNEIDENTEIKSRISNFDSYTQSRILSTFVAVKERINHLDSCPVCYEKDAIISSLRSIAPKLVELVRGVSGAYVSQNELEMITKEHTPLLIKNNKALIRSIDYAKHLQSTQPNFVGVLDLDSYIRKTVEYVAKISQTEQPSFSFKVGNENLRELLAAELLGKLELMDFVLPKQKADLQNVAMGSIRNPKGIFGKWISGETHASRLNEWELDSKAYELAKFRGEIATQPKEPPTSLEDEVKIQEQVIIDLIFNSYDSHSGQYIDFLNIDFARFLPPSEVISSSGVHYATLRSFLLSHPAASTPMNAKLLEKITSWDLKTIGNEFSPYVGSEQEFLEAAQKIKENLADAGKVQELTFTKIHPQAFQRFLKRMNALKQYISITKEPTSFGAFEAMYPNFAPFFKVLRRHDIFPGGTLSMQHQGIPRSLESIIELSKHEGLATPQEILDMTDALDILKHETSSLYDLYTTAEMQPQQRSPTMLER